MTQVTNFSRGYADADNETARLLAKTGDQNRTVDKVEMNAMSNAALLLNNIEYVSGRLACYRDAGLAGEKALRARAIAKLREMANLLEEKAV